jgi:hypothetical protein
MTTNKIPYSKFVVLIEDPATPGQFKAKCGFTSRSMKIDPDIIETTVPECDDEDAFVYISRQVKSLSMEISGEGTLHSNDVPFWRAFREAQVSWNCEVKIDLPAAQGGGKWSGKFVMGPWEKTGEYKNYVMFNISLAV